MYITFKIFLIFFLKFQEFLFIFLCIFPHKKNALRIYMRKINLFSYFKNMKRQGEHYAKRTNRNRTKGLSKG
jgi:hypothetical protein